MPVHDWSRISADDFNDFHLSWVAEIRSVLNRHCLPVGYGAYAEFRTAGLGPGVSPGHEAPPANVRSRRVVVREGESRRAVAVVELVSGDDKADPSGISAVVHNAVTAINHGVHVLMLDILPPTSSAPAAVHAAIWSRLTGESFQPANSDPQMAVSYKAAANLTAYVEQFVVGETFPEVALFLGALRSVSVPLESTYMATIKGSPKGTLRRIDA